MTRRLFGPLELGLGLALTVPFTKAHFYYYYAKNQPQDLFLALPVGPRIEGALGVTFR